MDKKKTVKNILRISSFSAIFAIIISLISYFFFVPLGGDKTAYGCFYKEKEDSLDLVMVGSSTVRNAFIPPLAYHDYGITSHSIVSAPTHLEVIEIAIDEIARTQKPSVVYIDLNGLNNQTKNNAETFVKDYYSCMPSGDAKNALKEKYDYLSEETGWEPFANHNSFRQQIFWESFIFNQTLYTKGYYPTSQTKEAKLIDVDPDKTLPLSEDGETYLNEILEKCKSYPNIHFLFGEMPRFLDDTISSFDAYQIHSPLEALYMVRSAKAKVEKYGYTFLDYSSPDLLKNNIGLDPKTDQMDAEHLNHKGAVKFTKYFMEYLKENFFTVTPSHDEETKNDFKQAYEKYRSIVEPMEKKLGME